MLGDNRGNEQYDFDVIKSQFGTSGNDRFYASWSIDYLEGGGGWDTVSYWYATSGVGIYLNDMSANWGAAYGDTYSGIEVIDGTRYNDNIVGDGGANAFWGDAGDDYLSGGTGCDTLGGGTGADIFHFSGALGSSNVDTINDFRIEDDDLIYLSSSVFNIVSRPSEGMFDWQFTIGSVATESYQRIIYNKSTGELFYDKDGVGGAAQIKFANIAPDLNLKPSKFFNFYDQII